MLKVRCLAIMGLALLAGVAGCSSSSSGLPDLATVSGTVTMGGKPLAKANVFFESAGGQGAAGTTDENGRYELYFKGGTKGAEIGVNKVRITTALDAPTPPDYKDPIPAKYNEASTLSVTVQPGENKHDFVLEP